MNALATARSRLEAASRSVARASASRPAAAAHAARDFELTMARALAAEIRWAFTPPRTWLVGVLANLALAVVWLTVQPLTAHGRHQDWVILVGTYFASFVLADVTTTNLLGADHRRVGEALSNGVPLWRVLIVKNLALVVLVGAPTLAAAMALTLWFESPARLAVTIPNVAVPVVSWIGLGNVVSILLPVSAQPVLRRWRRRNDRRDTTRWLASLTLPYVLYYVADPMDGVGHRFLWSQAPSVVGPVFGRDTKGFVHLGIAVAVWLIGTAVAVVWAHRHPVRLE
ncbi:hypothetical protein [Mycolicibacterium sediminis]|uniref:Uncharacterized protein n=1 Tax=Mycolicibacterium sediminis TaxID=1286180 RepID=A0A7I7QKK2_9MYCO|nr:hypothetical protein [Mycolicibacterium sediminis]BBY26406.1 hypothetical protein MSEDJ_05020 [Mycolicibacterium sediminis]